MSERAIPRAGWPRRARLLVEAVRTEPLTVSGGMVAGEALGLVGVVFQPVMLKVVIDAATSGDRSRMLGAVVLLGLTSAFLDGALRAAKDLRQYFDLAVWANMTGRVIRSIGERSELEHLERADVQDQIQQLAAGGGISMAEAFSEVLGAIRLFGTVIASLVVLAVVDIRLAVFPIFVIPSLRMIPRAQRIRREATDKSAELIRSAQHLHGLCTKPESAMELRVFGALDAIDDESTRRSAKARTIRISAERKAATLNAAGSLILAVGYVAALAVVASSGRGVAEAGNIVMVVSLAGQLRQQLEGVLGLGTRMAQYLDMFDRLAWLDDHVAEGQRHPDAPVPTRVNSGVTLRDVHFRYPGTDIDVLRGVDLHLPAGGIVAIAGDNGAGKTTLIKLLCGFYQPTQGQILVDDVDLADLDGTDWQHNITAAFQDFLKQQDTYRRSVWPSAHLDDATITAAGRQGEALEMTLEWPDRFDTHLGKHYRDGVALSGGQWQRVAVARAMVRSGLLLVLDEPTASLDPEAEFRLYEHYSAAAREAQQRSGAVTVLISHRFSTVRMADTIAVLENGRITEVGDHDTLMALRGRYYDLYNRQAAAYNAP